MTQGEERATDSETQNSSVGHQTVIESLASIGHERLFIAGADEPCRLATDLALHRKPAEVSEMIIQALTLRGYPTT